jgi:glycosyltransferase involved in cell wall biosynthesis
MNIYVVDYFREKKDNGLSTYVIALSTALEKTAGITLTYVLINSSHRAAKKETIKGVGYLHVPVFRPELHTGINFDEYFAGLLIEDIGTKKNILIHLNWINHCSFIWDIKQKVSCKVVLTKHCIPWREMVITNYDDFYRLETAFENKRKVELRSGALNQEFINYEYVDHIITVTDCAKENLELFFNVKPQKITTITNGVSLNFPKEGHNNKARLRRYYGFDPHERIILYAHVLHPRKGIMELVKIFEKFLDKNKKVRLIVAGNGDCTRVAEVAQKYWSKITFTGNLTKSKLYDFYQLADVGIVPSYVEQCSYTVIEMMYYKLPLIVTAVEGLKEIVPPSCGLHIKVNFRKDGYSLDENDLIKKLDLLVNDQKFATNLAMEAHAYAVKAFALDTMVNKTLDVFKKVWASPPESEDIDYIEILSRPDNPLVTVLMPCYNSSDYLESCIESILSQSYANFELLIVEDGSTDDTPKILKKYQDKRIRCITNIVNKGVTFSLNKGLKLAKGEYLARMDADDIMLPNRLALQVDFMEKNPDYGMVGGWHEVINQKGRVIQKLERFTDHNQLKLQMLFSNPFMHPAITIRTKLLKQLKYNEKFELCEDYELWTRVSSVAKVANLPHYLLQYRLHGNNLSNSNGELLKKNLSVLITRELDKLKVAHNNEELVLHLAMSLGYGSKYFNTNEKINKLNNWLDKLLIAGGISKNKNALEFKKFKEEILFRQCSIKS